MKNKYLLFSLLILLTIIGAYFAFAEFTGSTINTPADNSYDNDGIVNFNCTFTSNVSLTNISLYTNFTGSWEINATNSTPFQNNTGYNFTTSGISDGTYTWNCLATDNESTTRWANTTSNYTIIVDTTDPSIALNTPENSSTDTDGSVTFSYTPTDSNLDACVLWGNFNGWTANETDMSPTSGSDNTVTLTLSDGTYLWNIWCNDSAGNSAFNATNYTLNVNIQESTGGVGSNIPPKYYLYIIPFEITSRSVALKAGDSIEFTFENKQYTINAIDVEQESVKLTVSSVAQAVNINLEEVKEIDLNGDGINDLYLKLFRLSGNRAYVTVKQISTTESVSKIELQQSNELVTDSTNTKTKLTTETKMLTESVQTQPSEQSKQQAVQELRQPKQKAVASNTLVSALIIVGINIIGLTVFFTTVRKKGKKKK